MRTQHFDVGYIYLYPVETTEWNMNVEEVIHTIRELYAFNVRNQS